MEKVKEIIDKYKKLSASHIPIQEVAEIITLLQQPQFKVATEDSCEVLVKPEDYQDWLDSGRCLNKKNDDTWLDRCMEYDKAPLISKTELDLNQSRNMSNNYKKLSEDTIKGWTLTENELTATRLDLNKLKKESIVLAALAQSHFDQFTEANKQHKEVIDSIREFLELIKGSFGGGLTMTFSEQDVKTVDFLLSKLNKD